MGILFFIAITGLVMILVDILSDTDCPIHEKIFNIASILTVIGVISMAIYSFYL